MRGKLAITGASGQLGRQVADLLLDQGFSGKLILISRRPEALADLATRGAELRHGDFDAAADFSKALTGSDRMLLISGTDLERRTQQHQAALDAAAAAGVRHVLYTSMLSPEPRNPAVITASHRATEAALTSGPLNWTILRNGLYADYQVAEFVQASSSGQLVHNRGAGRIAYVARQDCAAVAAAVLSGEGHESRSYEVTGPETWSADKLAQLYAELGGKPVTAKALDDEDFITGLVGASSDGHARFGAELVASFGRAIREGWFSVCNDTVARLIGRAPVGLREVLAHATVRSVLGADLES
jgi:NAD(P)H dehydrogenase (quinone)